VGRGGRLGRGGVGRGGVGRLGRGGVGVDSSAGWADFLLGSQLDGGGTGQRGAGRRFLGRLGRLSTGYRGLTSLTSGRYQGKLQPNFIHGEHLARGISTSGGVCPLFTIV
jgi:hypothetical protein